MTTDHVKADRMGQMNAAFNKTLRTLGTSLDFEPDPTGNGPIIKTEIKTEQLPPSCDVLMPQIKTEFISYQEMDDIGRPVMQE